MAIRNTTHTQTRLPLNRSRVTAAAVALADSDGIESVTMRSLARELDVEAMSLYYHVTNKEDLLDGMIDHITGEICDAVNSVGPIPDEAGWKAAMRRQILTARGVFLQHPWAPGVLETRTTMSPFVVRYYDSLLGLMRQGGFSYDLAHHAMHALGSRALGFTQELFAPDGNAHENDSGDGEAAAMLERMADEAPHLVEMMTEISHDEPDSTLGWCDDQTEFEFGLDLILDGLERRAARH